MAELVGLGKHSLITPPGVEAMWKVFSSLYVESD